ncbi:MAG: hypothetical protein ACLGG0_05530 [Bacteriovoracia bacterium]
MSSMTDLSWLTEQSKDEVYTFNNVIHRKVSYESVATFQGYIVQHTHYFFSQLNQIYLFLIDDLAALAFFDKVFVRDGLLTIKLFFLRNPHPNGLQTKLIINSRFKKFIPKNWENNVYFYNYQYNTPQNSKKKNLIIAYHLDQFHCPDELLCKELSSLQSESYDEIMCLITGMPQNAPTDFVDKNIFSKAAITARNLKTPFRTVTLNEITPQKMAESDFLEINPYHFLFSDCYLRWYLLYNGANPLDSNWIFSERNLQPIHQMMVSPYHSVEICSSQGLFDSEYNTINEQQFFAADMIPSRNHLVNLCSDGYKRYVQSLVQSDAKNSN